MNKRTQESAMNNDIVYGSTAGLNVVWTKLIDTMVLDGRTFAVEHMIRHVGRNWYLDRRVIDGNCVGGTTQFSSKRAAIAAANS